jgi:parallel beta-helix repeat protein
LSQSNVWDNGYPSGGNYWSDYAGIDLYRGPYQNETGSDGIGDTPYLIDVDNQDNYPIIHPYGSIRNLDTNLTYLTIQSAINASETLNGHTIFVRCGIYYEQVVVNKTISLVGENKSNTIIDGNETGRVVHVIANNVVISGFTVQNSGRTVGIDGGIYLDNSSNSFIYDSKAIDSLAGIYLYDCSGCSIYGNDASHSLNIVGISLDTCFNCSVYGNNVTNNWGNGISIMGSVNCCAYGNNANNQLVGIELENSVNCSVWNNAVSNNRGAGIFLGWSSSNRIYHNKFINNSEHVSLYNSFNNTWDDGYPSGGNYWSDYNPPDEDMDKIGDVSYVIDENNTDRYPLIYPYEFYQPGYAPKRDINKDGTVDIIDITRVARAFDSEPGDLNWNPIVDMDINEIIDIADITKVAIDFGKES